MNAEGDHVAGQPVEQVAAQGRGRRVVRGGGICADLARRVVRDQAGVSGVAAGGGHRYLTNAGVPGQHVLDLPRLDAEAADLELAVHPPGDLEDAAAGKPAAEVAGAVHPRARLAFRVGDEPLGGERGPPQVAACELAAADAYLAGAPRREGLQRRVEDHDPRVGHGPADRDDGRRVRGRGPGPDVVHG